MTAKEKASSRQRSQETSGSFFSNLIDNSFLGSPIGEGLILLLFGIFFAIILLLFTGSRKTNIQSNSTDIKKQEEICTTNNGKWLSMYNECEGIDKDTCILAEGNYNECESACRHDKEEGPCIMSCVDVCKF